MATGVTVLTMIKTLTYRGDATEEFSNKYCFWGTPPVTTAEWDSLRVSIQAIEQDIFPASVHFSRTVGHDSTEPGAQAVYEYDYSVPGPKPPGAYIPGTGVPSAGDQAACIQWLTNVKSALGKPVYLRKYVHAAFMEALSPDSLDPPYLTALTNYADRLTGAAVWGGLTNPSKTATVVGHRISPYITTRTLHRRGKRKKVA
jgi:hypothetical protein